MKIQLMLLLSLLTNAANSNLSGSEWGAILGETFRYFCEKKPNVTVKTAVMQTIISLEN